MLVTSIFSFPKMFAKVFFLEVIKSGETFKAFADNKINVTQKLKFVQSGLTLYQTTKF